MADGMNTACGPYRNPPAVNPNPYADARTVQEVLFRVIGTASTCWQDLRHAGEFDSSRAELYGHLAMQRINEIWEAQQPLLGYATNEELVNELCVRYQTGATDKDYRTVGPHKGVKES